MKHCRYVLALIVASLCIGYSAQAGIRIKKSAVAITAYPVSRTYNPTGKEQRSQALHAVNNLLLREGDKRNAPHKRKPSENGWEGIVAIACGAAGIVLPLAGACGIVFGA